MAGYSKETERQNKALKDALSGKEHVKNYVQVGYERKQKPQGDVIPKMTEIMNDVRMPMFCPKCDKVMKKRFDNKMWSLYGHCFDCQIEFENKLKIKGEFDDWANDKIKKNRIAYLKDALQQMEEFKKWGIPISPYLKKCSGIKGLENVYIKTNKERSSIPYDIDGLVYKIDDLNLQKRLQITRIFYF